jgi:hypothetical protein
MRELLNSAWAVLKAGSRDDAQVALVISIIGTLTGSGVILAFLFGIAARFGAPGHCGLSCRLAGGGVALFAAAAAFAAGSVLGLLFGAPRWAEGNAQVQPQMAAPAPPVAPTPAPRVTEELAPGASDGAPARNSGPAVKSTAPQAPPPAATGSQPGPISGLRPNTSLEKVADWLTTIIVGLGLVHLKDLGERIADLGVWLTNAMTLDPHGVNGTPGVVIALAFAIAGFLLVYLWSVRFLPAELDSAYLKAVALKQESVALIKQKTELANQIDKFKTDPLFAVSPTSQDEMGKALRDLQVDEATVNEIVRRYKAATAWVDEPMRDFGPKSAEGYELDITVDELRPGLWSFTATVTCPSQGGGETAVWLLHNSYGPTVWVKSELEGRKFTYQNQTSGAFCLGALVLRQERTSALRLSLDMRNVPGVTEDFKQG